MTKVLHNRLNRLEVQLGITPEDELDDGFEIWSAERNAASHEAFLALAMTWPEGPQRDARVASVMAIYTPGPKRVRQRSLAAQKWIDEMLATRSDDAREVEIQARRGFDPDARRTQAR